MTRTYTSTLVLTPGVAGAKRSRQYRYFTQKRAAIRDCRKRVKALGKTRREGSWGEVHLGEPDDTGRMRGVLIYQAVIDIEGRVVGEEL